jgi:HD-GYP domain-containing protein (c-di-GMP phosphodiesterase class II)
MTLEKKRPSGDNDNDKSVIESSVYTAHLAKINETRQVIAKEDVFNDRGVLLVAKGRAITPEIAKAIVQFKLVKPIQESIAIENEVSAKDLLKHFTNALQEEKVMNAMHIRYELHGMLDDQCKQYDTFPILKQKITVMSERLPETYHRTLVCTWLSLLIAKEMGLKAHERSIVFLAALSHDIGMLHINQDVLNKKEQLNAEEWRQIQAHVVIGQKILEAIPQVNREVCRAVLEHHERCDGTGYPSGKIESELCLTGQIIALCDSVIAVYFNRFKPEGRGWRDIIPVLQMNRNAYLYCNYEVLITILRRSDLASVGIVSPRQMPEFINTLIANNAQTKCWYLDIKNYIRSIGFTHNDRKLHALQNIIIHVATAVNTSGIFQDDFVQWLEKVKENQDRESYRDIEDVYLMQEEIIFHLRQLKKMASLYVSGESQITTEAKLLLENCIEKSDSYEKLMQ